MGEYGARGGKKPAKRIIAWLTGAVLLALFALMEIYVRVICGISPAAKRHVESVTCNYPAIIGMTWTVILVVAVSISCYDYCKSRRKANLIKLIVWLTFLLGMIIYASFNMISSH